MAPFDPSTREDTPWSTVSLETLKVNQLIKKSLAFKVMQKFFTICTTAYQQTQSCVIWIQYILSSIIYLRFVLILSFRLWICLKSCLVPPGFMTKIMKELPNLDVLYPCLSKAFTLRTVFFPYSKGTRGQNFADVAISNLWMVAEIRVTVYSFSNSAFLSSRDEPIQWGKG